MRSTRQNARGRPPCHGMFPSHREYLGMLDKTYWKHVVHTSCTEKTKEEPMVGAGECGHRATQGPGAGSQPPALTPHRWPREVVCWKASRAGSLCDCGHAEMR